MSRLLVACTALLCAAPLASAQEADLVNLEKRDRIQMADGKVRHGNVVAYDRETKVLTWRDEDSIAEVQIPLDDLDERTVYHLAASHVADDNGEMQLAVADYARDIGLWKHSARHYRNAYEAAATEEEQQTVLEHVEVLKDKAAKALLEEGRTAMKRNKEDEAAELFELMLTHLPDQPETKMAGDLYGQIVAEREAKKAEKRRKRTEQKIAGKLETPEKDYSKCIDESREGLLAGSNEDKAERHYRSAVSAGERAVKRLEPMLKDQDEAVVAAAEGLNEHAEEALVAAYVNLGSHYYGTRKYEDAAEQANKALAMDPKNSSARSLLKRAQQAEKDKREEGSDWLYWRGVGRGGLRPGGLR